VRATRSSNGRRHCELRARGSPDEGPDVSSVGIPASPRWLSSGPAACLQPLDTTIPASVRDHRAGSLSVPGRQALYTSEKKSQSPPIPDKRRWGARRPPSSCARMDECSQRPPASVSGKRWYDGSLTLNGGRGLGKGASYPKRVNSANQTMGLACRRAPACLAAAVSPWASPGRAAR
jgi:hypothetical protein